MLTRKRILRGLLVLGLASFTCWSCAAPGMVGKGTSTEKQAEGQAAEAPKALAKTEGLVGVQTQDLGDETEIVVAGNGPFHDYEFRRLGEDRFVLELRDLQNVTNLPPLPPSSEKVKLTYADTKASSGLQIVGTMYSPLDRYVLNPVGNGLILTLQFSRNASRKAGTQHAAASYDSPDAMYPGAGSQGSSPPRHSTPAKKSKKAKTARQSPGSQSGSASDMEGGTPMGDAPPAAAGLAGKQYVGKPISLDLLDADLRNVLRLIADLTGTNLVIEPDVSGKVTLKVERVPWDQVLDMVLSMNDLGKERVGNVIRIAKQNKLKQEWTQTADEIRARQELLEIAKDVGEINTVYYSVNYAQPADVAGKIKENMSEKGKLAVDDRSSLIIYSDYPSRVENARRLLARLDRPTPQVLVEARIVTVTSDATRDLGINWRVQGRSGAAAAGQPTYSRDFEVNIPAQIPFSFSIAEVINNTLMNVDLLLAAQETINKVNVLAAPKVLTLNHVKATINQGQQIPYLKLSDLNVASTEFKDAVLELQVTPHITPDRKIRLEIMAKQDEPSAQTFQVGASLVPGIDSRKINTELLVDDGNIVVIGGVLRRNDTQGTTATPGLWKVPILGRLFRIDNTRTQRTELLIFISPKIVEASSPPTRG